jgi:hypothetical protein
MLAICSRNVKVTVAWLNAAASQTEETHIIILLKLDIHDKLSRLLAHSSIAQSTVRQALSLLQADNDLAHDLELLPIDATSLLVADESRVALFR